MDLRTDVDGGCRSCSSLELELAGTPLNVNPDGNIGWSTSGAVQYYNHDIEKRPEPFDFLSSGGGLSQESLADSDNPFHQQVIGAAFAEENWSSESSYPIAYDTTGETFIFPEALFPSWDSSSDLALDSALTLPPNLPQTPPPSIASFPPPPPPPTHLREVLERIEALEAVATPSTPALTYGANTPPRKASGSGGCACEGTCHRAISRNLNPPPSR